MNALLVADLEHDEMIVREGPGRRLRAARECKGLDAGRMAKQLHLSRSVIDGIEADDYASLPSSVFVRGYLRNYARAVGEPVEMVLAAYERVRPADTENRRVRGITLNKTEIRSNHFLVQLMSVLIVLGLAALLAIWWQGYIEQPFTLATTGPEPLISTEAAQGAGPAEATQSAAHAPAAPQPPNAVGSNPAALAAANQNQSPSGSVPQGKADPQANPAPIKDEAGSHQPTAPMAVAAEEAQVGGAVAAEIPTSHVSTLLLSLKGESWVDVRDGKGKIVFAGVLNKGSEKSIQGDGPFQLVLGNAPAVDVSLDGKRVETGNYTKKNIARFTVDPKKI